MSADNSMMETSMASISMMSGDGADNSSNSDQESDNSNTRIRKVNDKPSHVVQKHAPAQLDELEEVYDEEESGQI